MVMACFTIALRRLLQSLARMQDRKADHFFALVADNNVVIRHLAVGRVAGLFEIHIERIRFRIIGDGIGCFVRCTEDPLRL